MKKNAVKGFTLLEILLVVAAIAILAAIVIVAINPGKQLGDTRNARRSANINAISSAVSQYNIDNSGSLPAAITTTSTEICKTSAVSCTGLIDLSVLTNSGKYIVSMPIDPNGGSTNGTGYFINKATSTSRVTVSAPSAENGATISVSN